MTPIATSRRSNEIPLYLIRDTSLVPRTTTPVWVQTANRCAIKEPVYCRGYPALQQRCCVMNGLWQGSATVIPLLVTNVTDRHHVLRAATLVAIADPQMTIPMHVSPVETHARGGESDSVACVVRTEPVKVPVLIPKWTRTGRAYTQDIRLTTRYIQYIESKFAISKERFQEACYNGGNLALQDWTAEQRVWINPPWELANLVVSKLLREMPKEFILVLPVPAETEPWYEVLKQCPVPEKRRMILPRTVDTGMYHLWYDGRQRSAKPLPFPEWETMAIYGRRSDLRTITMTQRAEMADRLEATILPVLETVDTDLPWLQGVQVGDLEVQQRDELVQLLKRYPTVLQPGPLGLTTMGECTIPLQTDTQPIASRPFAGRKGEDRTGGARNAEQRCHRALDSGLECACGAH